MRSSQKGLFRPLDPVPLAEHDLVSLVITPARVNGPPFEGQELERQRRALGEALDEANRLPLEGPDDGFTGADHDLILHGWKK